MELRDFSPGRRERPSRVARGAAGLGILETLVATAAVVTILSRPRSAPGPSEELTQRERRARKAVMVARESLQKGDRNQADQESRQQLAEAKRELFDVERELEEAGADLKKFPLPEYLQASDCPGQLRIAVTGASGVGKSSWINALRRLLPDDKDAAATGVTETTLEPTMYRFRRRSTGPVRGALDRVLNGGKRLVKAVIPFKKDQGNLENFLSLGDRVVVAGLSRKNIEDGSLAEVVGIYPEGDIEVQLIDDGRFARCRRDQLAGVLPECVIFDLPGVGTPNYPQATYLKDMGLRHYDFVVLLTSTRFTEAELLLMEGLRYWGVPFFLVRNKVDVDVQNEIDKVEEMQGKEVGAERKKEIELETIQSIREFFKEEFNITDLYLVSSKRKLIDQFEFRKLETDMEVVLKKQRLIDTEENEAPDEPEVAREVQDVPHEDVPPAPPPPPAPVAAAAEEAFGARQRIDGLLEENGVVVFSKSWCPYCAKAKALLQAEGFGFVAVELDLLPQEESDEMLTTLGQMTGARTVPRIFSSGESLGGCDDLVALQRSGQLASKMPAGTTVDEASLAEALAAVQGAKQALLPDHVAGDAAKDEAEAKAAARAAARQRFREELAAAAAKE